MNFAGTSLSGLGACISLTVGRYFGDGGSSIALCAPGFISLLPSLNLPTQILVHIMIFCRTSELKELYETCRYLQEVAVWDEVMCLGPSTDTL
jgi:hypothetical protein